MKIAIGQRLRSQVDATELIVVRCTPGDLDVRCGGAKLIGFDEEPEPDPDLIVVPIAPLPRLGKRYTDPNGGLEVLVTKAGDGVLTLDGEPLLECATRPLPASD